jgi:8-oxo-dGTP diphosphatase
VGVYSDPNRDPRGHIVSVAYTARLQDAVEPRAGSDAKSAEWKSDWQGETLAFNHAEIIADLSTGGKGQAAGPRCRGVTSS